MPIQSFVDDSGGKGDTRHFVMVGLVADSDAWMAFSEEWQACLREPPGIAVFKMKDAASCSGQFYGMTTAERDKKLRFLARIINRYARFSTASVINLEAHEKVWAIRQDKRQRDPYFWPFHNSILDACFTLWDLGVRDRFEIIFDENVVFGPRAKLWYPAIKEFVKTKEGDVSSILPIDPLFRDDSEFLPLQAADLYAWYVRKKHDFPEFSKFDWLFNEMPTVELSNYPQYYDEQRMKDVWNDTVRMVKEREIPREILDKFKELYEG